jgi:NADPH:quinone reductase-like Zn-dependent oxidoreductase/malonyl CoA-acyl carrier protein transacylase
MYRSRDILCILGADWDLVEEILRDGETSRIHEAAKSQPATSAVQIALVDLLASMGVHPAATLGHSSGEIVAAYAAGYISQSTALRIAYSRGLVSSLDRKPGLSKGAMLSVALSETDAMEQIKKLGKGIVVVACINSGQNTTVSGDEEAIDELAARLSMLDIFNRKLRVDNAYHSHHMQAVAIDYKQLMGVVTSEIPTSPVTFFSTVNATAKSENFNADYWCNNLTSQVRFKEALEKICHAQDGYRQVFLEIGPHNALAGPIRQVLTGMQNPVEYDYISILRRGVDATQSSLEVIGKLFVLGQQVDLSVAGRLDPQHENAKTLHSLPGYSWNHSKGHWHESRLSKDHRLRKHPYHDLLGVKCLGITSFDLSWRHMISVASLPWLIDHVVDGMVVFPGSGYLCMAIEAVSQLAKDTFPGESRLRITLKDVEFLKALLVPPTPQRTEVQISLSAIPLPSHSTTKLHHRFRVTGFGNDDVWDEHCRGYIQVDFDDNVVEASIVSDLSLRNGACLERPYQQLRENGNNYGPTFTGISEMAISDKHAIATVNIPHVVDAMPTRYMQPHIIHPTSLDIVMHTSLPLVARRFGPGTIIPIHIDKLIISSKINHKPGAILSVHAQLDDLRARTAEVDIEAFNDGNISPSLSLSGLKLRAFNARSPVKEARSSSLSAYWNLCWDLDVDCLAAQHLLADQVGSSDHSSWKEKLRILNTASVGYIRRCLQFIDVQGLRVKSEYKPLVDWMRRLSNSRGSNGHCPEQKQDSHYSATDETNFAEMKIVARTGPQLPMIVSGEVDALQLVLEDNLLYTAYQDHSSMLCYKLLRQYAKHLVFKKSSLRILEIGGGTGGATLPFLRAMKAAGFTPSVYDFTDVSTGFFERAAEKLADFPVQYRKLDIEEDPAQQGFEPQTYDVVLAFNCLHVTSSIETTLRHARSLLKPDGRLILIEIVNPQPYHHISFGTLPGYWKGGIDGRPDGPFMSETRWRETLSAIGMNLSLSKKDNESAHISSLMVAHSHESLARPAETALQIVSVGSAFESVKSKMLAALLDQGLPTVVKTIDEGLNEDPAVKIIFDDGEHPLLSNVSSDMFRRLCALLNTQTRIMWISISRDQTSIMTARKQLITGLARSAHAENDNLQFVTVDVQQKFDDTDPYMSDLLLACLYRSFLVPNTNAEREYVIRNDAVQIPRLLPCDALNEAMAETQQTLPTKQQSFASHPSILLRGDTRSLEEPIFELDEAKLAENQIELQVQAVGVPISDTTTPFYEYSGTIVKLGSSVTSLQVGDRVMAIGTSPYANRPYVFAFDAHRIPNHMTSITAAALPLALITAYYTLFELMETGSSQTIMLHGARTITHRVILRVAQRKGINLVVFEPESAEASRLQKLFHVPASHIIHSAGKRRRREQQHEVKEVDMIITSELCDMPSQLLALLNPFGKIVSLQGSDTVKVDINSHLHLPPNVTLHMCDMHAFWRAKPREAALLLSQAVALTMSTEESFSAIPIIVKPIDDIKEVIKEDESSRSLSKIVLEVRDDSVVSVVRPSTSDFELDSHATFVIAGGLGDLGQRLLLFMAKHGAKHIVALSRRAPDEHVSKRLAANIPDGCQIHHIRCDVACEDDVRVTIVTIASKGLPPVKGVIQSAMKLQVSPIPQPRSQPHTTANNTPGPYPEQYDP